MLVFEMQEKCYVLLDFLDLWFLSWHDWNISIHVWADVLKICSRDCGSNPDAFL